ncbi:hypothetical protein CF15_03915 [Pyrodictium occultum]|uniref:Radical SAM core domain-containing protein n=1 Tax=Pyrodictium occultum TaxID=2309 RepID=A0A0V8RV59_PYROC|nr:radical SAM protein [Pyrodictium occultum]KSW11947.1 hypothetical protein CF15_03915 [Pyrodictium occultum]
MRRVKLVKDVYSLVGSLPLGCIYCVRGSKIVVFITGLCDDNCFYCPVSPAKLHHDVITVDEEPVKSLEDIVLEAYRIGADGASITGGDPLVRLDRTVRAIRLLKDVFGDGFHVHLYTSGRYATSSALLELERAGLDEIRFHVVGEWVLKRIEAALHLLERVRVGVEIPVLPDRVEETKKLIKRLDDMGVEFINLNELEVSEANVRQLILRGYLPSHSRPVVKGSQEAAMEIVKWAAAHTRRITVHYCPAVYKDSVQMRVRLIRKALRTARPYEEVTPEGMVAVVEAEPVGPALELARRGYGELLGGRVLLHPGVAVPGARLRKRYPAVLGAGLPSELQSVAENRDNSP